MLPWDDWGAMPAPDEALHDEGVAFFDRLVPGTVYNAVLKAEGRGSGVAERCWRAAPPPGRDTTAMAGHGMVFLGFGKYVRADRIYALEPITGEERGSGSRTLVWVEGIPEPVVASRTQQTILDEIEAIAEPPSRSRRSSRGAVRQHPQLFGEE
jgi:hypothetical protein